jgi:hypothetical protein
MFACVRLKLFGPEMIRVERAHHGKFRVTWRGSFDVIVGNTQRPFRVRKHVFDRHAGVSGHEKRLSVASVTQYTGNPVT